MPSYNYDYFSLSTGQRWHAASRSRLWQGGLAALVLLAFIVLLRDVFYHHVQAYNPLDHFQQLHNISAVASSAADWFATLPSGGDDTDRAVVSSLYTDSYAVALTTLGHSLRSANVTARMILMYLPERVSNHTLCLVAAAGWTLYAVPFIPPPHGGKGLRKHFKDQYTKLNLWTLDRIGITRLVYLDGDMLVRRNFDELFTLPFTFAAVPDVFADAARGFTLGFNAGLLVTRPSSRVFESMLSTLAHADYPPEFAEQAFLNLFFGAQTTRLPYVYNANLSIKQRSPALWAALADDVRIVHYTVEKPFPTSLLQRGEVLDADNSLDAFFEERRQLHGGLWAQEIGWWEDVWRDMRRSSQDPILLCERKRL